jgi:branched-chain amino acid transport system ATP-binding protein
MSWLIEVASVSKSYGAYEVLKNVTFDVNDCEGYAIIGPNGAGKTTLFKVLTGEIGCSKGSIRFLGQDITDLPASERVRMGFGRTFQVARIFPDYTAMENVVVAIEMRMRNEGLSAGRWFSWRPSHRVVEEAQWRLERMGLVDKRFVQARNFSHGDKKRLELTIALTSNPRALMLDEPTAGMSPVERQQTTELLKQIREENGVTLMLTEHDMDVVFGLADRIMVLNYGEIVVIGDPQEVRQNPTVAEIYLGREMVHA